MKTTSVKTPIILCVSLLLSACASFSTDPHPGKVERVGVLLVDQCSQTGCGFSLLEQDMQTPLAILNGQMDKTLKGHLIAVLGEALPARDRLESIRVERTRAITSFDYQPFFSETVPTYTSSEFGCVSLWDQAYSWRLDGRQPILIATLTHPFDPQAGQLKLEFDGLTRALLSSEITPENAHPCQLR